MELSPDDGDVADEHLAELSRPDAPAACPSPTDGAWSGHGEMSWPSGDSYQGQFRNGLMHGRGACHFADGSRYVGQWRGGIRAGTGTMHYVDGAQYEGQWHGGCRHGRGDFFRGDGTWYRGDFVDGLEHGQGTLTAAPPCADATDSAELASPSRADSPPDVPNGSAWQLLRYEGAHARGERHGPATLLFADGRVEALVFQRGVPWGPGVRWHLSRAWRLEGGEVVGDLSLAEARALSEDLGLPIDEASLCETSPVGAPVAGDAIMSNLSFTLWQSRSGPYLEDTSAGCLCAHQQGRMPGLVSMCEKQSAARQLNLESSRRAEP